MEDLSRHDTEESLKRLFYKAYAPYKAGGCCLKTISHFEFARSNVWSHRWSWSRAVDYMETQAQVRLR